MVERERVRVFVSVGHPRPHLGLALLRRRQSSTPARFDLVDREVVPQFPSQALLLGLRSRPDVSHDAGRVRRRVVHEEIRVGPSIIVSGDVHRHALRRHAVVVHPTS